MSDRQVYDNRLSKVNKKFLKEQHENKAAVNNQDNSADNGIPIRRPYFERIPSDADCIARTGYPRCAAISHWGKGYSRGIGERCRKSGCRGQRFIRVDDDLKLMIEEYQVPGYHPELGDALYFATCFQHTNPQVYFVPHPTAIKTGTFNINIPFPRTTTMPNKGIFDNEGNIPKLKNDNFINKPLYNKQIVPNELWKTKSNYPEKFKDDLKNQNWRWVQSLKQWEEYDDNYTINKNAAFAGVRPKTIAAKSFEWWHRQGVVQHDREPADQEEQQNQQQMQEYQEESEDEDDKKQLVEQQNEQQMQDYQEESEDEDDKKQLVEENEQPSQNGSDRKAAGSASDDNDDQSHVNLKRKAPATKPNDVYVHHKPVKNKIISVQPRESGRDRNIPPYLKDYDMKGSGIKQNENSKQNSLYVPLSKLLAMLEPKAKHEYRTLAVPANALLPLFGKSADFVKHGSCHANHTDSPQTQRGRQTTAPLAVLRQLLR